MSHRFGTKTETLIGYPAARVLSWLAKEMPGECAGYVLNATLPEDVINQRVRVYMNRTQAFHDVYQPNEVAPGQWFEFVSREDSSPGDILVPFSDEDVARGFVDVESERISIDDWFVYRE